VKKIQIRLNNTKEEIEGLYFFTQCLDELLFDHTNDSYKAPALNLVTRLYELRMMSKHVMESEINPEALRSFIDELEWGIGVDPVISHEEKTRYLRGLKRISLGTPSPQKVIAYSAWLIDVLIDYFENLKEKIKITIHDGNKKTLLRSLANSFAAHIELENYSRRYAYQQVQRKLYRKLRLANISINVEQTLKSFIDDFDGSNFESTVYLRGEKNFLEIKDLAAQWNIGISDKLPQNVENISEKNNFTVADSLSVFLAVTEINDVKDRYNAKYRAELRLRAFVGMIKYHCHEKSLAYSSNALVKMTAESRDVIFIVGQNPNPILNRFTDGNIDRDGIRRIAELMSGVHLDSISTRKIINVIEYHRNAITAPNLESQLISLWASLEGLLPHPGSGVRIKHFTEIISNILVLSYPKKLFKEISRQLHLELKSNKSITDQIDAIGMKSWIENIIALICCKENESLGQTVLAALDGNLLLRFRMKELYDSFSDAKRIKSTLDNHKKKISWHINRIYMTRNLIVHSAEAMPYLEIIVENLHDYLDSVIETISYYAIKSKAVISIASLVEAILTDYELRMDYLTNNLSVKIDKNNFINMVHGINNPISLNEHNEKNV